METTGLVPYREQLVARIPQSLTWQAIHDYQEKL